MIGGEPDVVISGIGCRLPSSDHFDDFSRKLISGENFISKKHNKWSKRYGDKYPDYCGDIEFTSDFDHSFFKVSSNLAASIDLLAKYILPSTFEALLDAGLTERDVGGSNSQVYASSCLCETDVFWRNTVLDGYSIVGRNRGMLSNRVSFWLDMKGSSTTSDSSWVSGIELLIAAATDIKAGRCDVAMVITGNILLTRNIYENFQNLGIISKDGVSRPYDEEGTGIVRSDSVITFILQKSTDAKRSYITIVDALCLNDGEREDLTKSSVQSWESLFQEFYSKSGIKLSDIGYIEGNGFGIKEEDETELKAIENFFCKNRSDPVLVGSIKSNMGHSEASATFCSILKAITIFKYQIIPKNLNYSKPILSCDGITSGQIKIPQDNIPYTDDKLVAINALGLAGTYSHMVLGPPKTKKVNDENLEEDNLPRLVLLSSRKSDDVELLIDKISKLPYDPNYYHLVNKTLGIRREIYLGRGYVVRNQDKILASSSDVFRGKKRQIWFVFTGMGSQWISMGKDLLKVPVINESLNRSHQVLAPKGINLLDILTTNVKTTYDNILNSFVGIAAIQIALIDLLNELGVKPDYLIGHSVGELGCSYADGCLTAEQMILAAYYRGKASLESQLVNGMMAAIGKGYKEMIDIVPEDIDIACHNSKTSCTLSGPAESVNAFVEKLQIQKIFAKAVNVSNIAYHSRYIRPAAPKLLQYLKELIPNPKPRSRKWISTSIPRSRWDEDLAKYCSPDYLTNNLLSSVLFEEGSHIIPPGALCIEIAPHGLLQSILRTSLHEGSFLLSLTNKSAKDSSIYLLEALGKIHISGVQMDIDRLYPPVSYPVPLQTPGIAQLIHWAPDKSDYFNQQDEDPRMVSTDVIKGNSLKNIWIFNQKTFCSPASLLGIVWKCFLQLRIELDSNVPITFEKLKFHEPLPISRSDTIKVNVRVCSGTGNFEVTKTDEVILLTGILNTGKCDFIDFDVAKNKILVLDKEDIYTELSSHGFEFNEYSKTLDNISIGGSSWLGNIKWTGDWSTFLDAMFQLSLLKRGENVRSNLELFQVRKLTISTQDHLDQHKVNGVLEAKFDLSQNIIRCGGVEMIDVKWRTVPQVPRYLVTTQTRFIPYFQPDFMNERMYMTFVLDLVRLNKPVTTANKQTINVSVISSEDNGTRSKIIEDTLREYNSKFPINVSEIKDNVWSETKEVDIVLVEEETLESVNLCSPDLRFVLLVTKKKVEQTLHSYVLISSLSFSNNLHMYFYKKMSILDVNEVEIIKEPLNYETLSQEIISKKKWNRVLIVARKEPEEGISYFVAKVRKNVPGCRFLYILDPDAPQFDLTNTFYSNQLAKGLSVNVYKHGTWGLFHDLTFDKTEVVLEKQLNRKTKNGLIIDHVILNKDETIAYSGKQKGRQVMGVGLVDTNNIISDETLTWSLPEKWTTEEGATIANSFTVAFEAFNFIPSIAYPVDVMIVGGYSTEGVAAIVVALKYAQQVFVTVEDEIEMKKILEIFPKLNVDNIVYHSDPNFDVYFLEKHKGQGVHMIYDTLHGEKTLSALRCATPDSHIVFLNKEDWHTNTQIGMAMFLENITLTSTDLKKVLDLTPENKIILKSLIENSIDDGTIRPIDFSKHLSSGLGYKIQELKVPEQVNAWEELIRNKPNSSFIVVGDGTPQWLEVVEQLINDGAENIIVIYTGDEKKSLVQRRLLVSNKKKININLKYFSSEHEIKTENIIKDALHLGPLLAIFIVSQDGRLEDSKIPAELERHWRTPCEYFICFVNNNNTNLVKLCKRRYESVCKTTLAIQNPGTTFLSGDICKNVDKFVPMGPFLKISHHSTDNKELDLDDVLTTNLPSSLNKLKQFGSSLTSQIRLVRLQTLNTGVKTNDTATLVFIPGLEDDPKNILQQLSRKLMYPAYYVNWSSENISIDDMIINIAEEIKNQTLNCPFVNIVGVSWGNFIALKVCKYLEGLDIKLRLFLVGYSHFTLKSALDNLQTSVSNYLLSKYFESTKVCTESNDWLMEDEEQDKADVERGLKMVAHFLTEIQKEDCESYNCKSAVLMFCNDFEVEKKINKSTVEMFIRLDHRNLQESKEFLFELHQHAIFSRSTDIFNINQEFTTFLKTKEKAAVCKFLILDQY